ncbi:MAG: mechanosensitive ion channel domain-containing protein [Syntrophales bacterium]
MKLLVLLISLGVFFSLPVLAAWDITQLPPGFTVADPGGPVELEGKVLFYLRVNSKVDTAQKRAQTLSASILKLAEDPLFSPKKITVRDSELSSDIMAGDKILYPLWEFEARVMGKPANELAREDADKIRQAIAAYQKEHSLRNLIIRIGKTVLALFALIILVILVNRGMRHLNRAILASDRIRSVKLGEFEFFTADRIKAVITSAVKMVRVLIILVLLYSYFHLGLSFFPATQGYALRLYESLFGAVGAMGEAIWRQTPSLVFLAVLFFITRYVLKTLRFFFEQVGAGKVTVAGLDTEVAPITYRIVKLLVLAFVAVIAYPYIPGSESSAFKGISIFLGVLFSLGSSSAIANLIAGVSLTYMRSFRIGDVIKVGDSTGVVLERRLYITRLKTFKNEVITIPNGIILTSHVTNLSQEVKKGDGLILHTSVTIGYDAPWETVHHLLIEAANRTKHVLKSPSPFVLQTALNDFYVAYELNAYTDAPEIMPWVYGELHKNIQNTFNEGGVEIMSPHHTQIRDGNHTTIPADYLPPDYEAPAIRIANMEHNGKKENT